MPPSLQGLNVIHPVQPQDPYLTDSQDLLSVPPFPDLTAQLDLWTNLAFSSDEPPVRTDKKGRAPINVRRADDDDNDVDSQDDANDGNSNSNVASNDRSNSTTNASQVQFDFAQFLAGFGVDPFVVPPAPQQNQQLSSTPSLAQLLSLPQAQIAALAAHSTSVPQTPAPTGEQPPAKRARTRKASVSVSVTTDSPDSFDSEQPDTTTPLNAAEDKRRRNTAASARFRLKKKEREAALEKKAKEFETRVTELERECEALRRENGWLKGLVVGVTGAGVAPAANAGKTAGKRRREGGEGEKGTVLTP